MVTAQVRCLSSEGVDPGQTAQIFLKNQGWWLALSNVRSAIDDIQHGRIEQIEAIITQINGEESAEEPVNARNQRRRTSESSDGETGT